MVAATTKGATTASTSPDRGSRAAFAAKTVAASAACALAFVGSPRELRVLAGVSGAFATQFVAGESRPAQRDVFLGASTAFVLLVLAATAVAGPPPHPFAHEALLVVTAFAVFPIRAALPGRPFFPLFGFTTVLLTTLLAPRHTTFETGVAALTGVVAAYVVHFGLSSLHAPPVVMPVPSPSPSPSPSRAQGGGRPTGIATGDLMLGVRGAVATVLASLLAHELHLARPYWVELTAVVLINETWRESMQKGIERVIATALGCVAGWLLQQALATRPGLVPFVLFACVFFAVYERPVSYPRMMFFLSLYVVLLFSMIGQWTIATAVARVVDTGVGVAIAVVVTLVTSRARRHGEERGTPEGAARARSG